MAHQTNAFLGVVTGVTGVPGPASEISYTVRINFTEGAQEVSGIQPAIERWPDTLNVTPIEVGTAVWVASVRGNLQLMARELPSFAPCNGTPSFPGRPTFFDLDAFIAAVATASPEQRAWIRKALL